MRRKIILSILIILISSLGISEGLGVIPSEKTQRITDLETNLTVEFLNLGNTTRNVEVKFETSKNYNITPKSFEIRLEPSEIRTLPNGGSWFSIGNGKYASLREESSKLTIDPLSPVRNFSIPLTVTSTPLKGETVAETGQKVYQKREIIFNVYTISDILETDEGVLYEEGKLFKANNSGSNLSKSAGNSRQSMSNSSNKPKKGLTEENEKGNRAINTWTMVLIGGIVLSIAVIWSEL
ncbi:MAG: hypothetical protein ABEK10_00510 [Candidatus Nanosalina sp.]